MDLSRIVAQLRTILAPTAVLADQPLSEYTTFRIGGACDLMILPENEEQTVRSIGLLRQSETPFVLLGNGSNVLVHDEGIRGCVVKLNHKGDEVRVDPEHHTMFVGAGEGMLRVAEHACRHGLGGTEFASGIPGTLGGTVYMNAGAYGREMKDIVQSVRVLTQDGHIMEMRNGSMEFSYRSSAAQKNGHLILGATLQLYPDDPENIRYHIDDFTRRRREKQPLVYASAGSTFKRPNGHYAAKLIDEAGLKGLRVGDAQVSTQHAGFIVNLGHANYADVVRLMDLVKEKVFKAFGVELKPEVHLLGPTL